MWSDSDHGYGDTWGGFSTSDITVSDASYASLEASLNGGEMQVAENPWSPQAMKHDALTAGDTIPAMRSNGLGGDYFGAVGTAVGRSVGTALGGGLGGFAGGAAGGYIGNSFGHAIDPREAEPPVENYGSNR